MRKTALHIVTRLHSAQTRKPLLSEELTERGMAALAAARKGADLYIWTPEAGGMWRLARPEERALAEELALQNPLALVAYAAKPAKRRRRRR